jgi:hypothetical protein
MGVTAELTRQASCGSATNLPNRPIFGQPGNQLRTPTFGVLTIGLKFVF